MLYNSCGSTLSGLIDVGVMWRFDNSDLNFEVKNIRSYLIEMVNGFRPFKHRETGVPRY